MLFTILIIIMERITLPTQRRTIYLQRGVFFYIYRLLRRQIAVQRLQQFSGCILYQEHHTGDALSPHGPDGHPLLHAVVPQQLADQVGGDNAGLWCIALVVPIIHAFVFLS